MGKTIRQIGPYRLIKRLGSGGMGAVYKAEHLGNGQVVALKVVAERIRNNPTLMERFRREAKVAYSFRHPNVAACLAYDDTGPVPYMALEYLDGGDLVRLMHADGGRLSERKALAIGLAVARAITAAARLGIVHRDIKPQNILFTSGGEVRLTDFGLVQLEDDSALKTQANTTLGTPHYMPLEQAQGLTTVDWRSDLYSLGATLYHVLTGRPPYEGQQAIQVLTRLVSGPPPHPRDVRHDLSSGLCQVLAAMMARKTTARYPEADQVVTDLAALLKGEPPAIAGRMVKSTAIAFLPEGQSRELGAPVPEDGVVEDQVRALPGGATRVTRVLRGGKKFSQRLWISDCWRANRKDQHQRFPVAEVAFDPHDRYLASATSEGLGRLWDLNSGRELVTFTAHRCEIDALAVHPAGELIATGDRASVVHIWDARRAQSQRQINGEIGIVYDLKFSPDGAYLAASGTRGKVVVWRLQKNAVLSVFEALGDPAPCLAYDPKGDKLACGDVQGRLRLFAPKGQRVLSLWRAHKGPVTAVRFSPDGWFLATGGEDGTFALWEANTGRQVLRLEGLGGPARSLAFSPDGRFLLGGGFSPVIITWELDRGTALSKIENRDSLLSLALDKRGERLAVGNGSGAVALYHSGLVKKAKKAK